MVNRIYADSGDTVLIKAGVYREAVLALSAGRPKLTLWINPDSTTRTWCGRIVKKLGRTLNGLETGT
jgi:hypothetical protein